MNTRFRLVTAFILPLLLLCMTAMTAPVFGSDSPIRIEADHMSAMEKDSSVIFTGNVDAIQDDVRIRADKLTVIYTQKAKNGDDSKIDQKVEKLVCDGKVEISRGDWLGTSGKMVYLSKERQFILSNGAKAWQDQNMVSGDKIIYYIDEGRSEILSDKTRATIGGNGGDPEKKPGRVNMTILQQ